MAFTLDRWEMPLKAASNMPAKSVVTLDTVANQVKPVGSTNVRPFGILQATGLQGYGLTVYEAPSVEKLICGASVGFGAEVAIATYGVASLYQGTALATVAQLGPAAGASGFVVWAVGLALEPAAAGDVFSVQILPRQISGTP